jgi:hypothetical protein
VGRIGNFMKKFISLMKLRWKVVHEGRSIWSFHFVTLSESEILAKSSFRSWCWSELLIMKVDRSSHSTSFHWANREFLEKVRFAHEVGANCWSWKRIDMAKRIGNFTKKFISLVKLEWKVVHESESIWPSESEISRKSSFR